MYDDRKARQNSKTGLLWKVEPEVGDLVKLSKSGITLYYSIKLETETDGNSIGIVVDIPWKSSPHDVQVLWSNGLMQKIPEPYLEKIS